MRKLILSMLMLVTVASTFAQEPAKDKFKKGKVVGVHFTIHDYATAADIKSNGLANVLTRDDWSKLLKRPVGLAFSYTQGISNNLDLMARVGATSLKYPLPGRNSTIEKYMFEADVNLNVKLLPDNYIVSPYVSVGAGMATWGGYLMAYMPLGTGLQVNLGSESFVFLQTQYRAPVTTNNGVSHLFWGVGFATNIK